MKKYFLYTLAAVGLLFGTTSCDNFGNVNDDPEHLNDSNMNPKLLFTQVQNQLTGSDWDAWRVALIYYSNMMQHTASVDWTEGTFYTWNAGFNAGIWENYYYGERGAIRNINLAIKKWEAQGGFDTEVQFARILRAYLFQVMTDTYGDVPYFDASKALEGNNYPKYDKQAIIYDDLLTELDDVNTKLKTAKNSSLAAADIMYNGDIEPWRKFANALMLRVAMRLSKVEPAKAQEWAKKAVENGVFTSYAETAFVPHGNSIVTNDSAEPFGKILSESDPQAFYISEYFLAQLKDTQDPRIHLIATKCERPNDKWSSNKFDYGNSADIDAFVGLPSGYTLEAGDWNIEKHPGFPEESKSTGKVDANGKPLPVKDWRNYYALPNRKTFGNPEAPAMLVTHAQTQFLLAEAASRGWISGDAEAYFKVGLQAAMDQFRLYDMAKKEVETFLTADKVNAYINARVAAFNADPMKEINWQYYVLSFGSEYETFANWRRSGYPEIKSVYEAPHNIKKYPLSVTDQIPRRMTYPTSEAQINGNNYQQAVSSLNNGDNMDSRVWWDVK